MTNLRFATFSSDVELPFWMNLASRKVDVDRLDESAQALRGFYEIRPSDPPEASCRMQLHGSALNGDISPSGLYRAEGMIKNVNTIESYKSLDKAAVLAQAARTIWDAISDGTILSCPSLLASFSVICFADIKKYKFTYLFAFPALHSDPAWHVMPYVDTDGNANVHRTAVEIISHLTIPEATSLTAAVETWRSSVDSGQRGFFLAKRHPMHPNSKETPTTTPSNQPLPEYENEVNWTIGSLRSFENGFFDGVPESDRFISFADPSTYPSHPGWMLRNLLVLIRRRWKLQMVQILCYRDVQGQGQRARSLVVPLRMSSPGTEATPETDPDRLPKVTGWEQNSAGKLINKAANLGEYMNPHRLADQAVDLNLKLMKWRIAPKLNLERIKNTRCLLLGAGTLGSYVSRNLMGWGVRKITFVDNGSVSFSNPVRQPLFTHSDCLNGGVKKATRAAESLKEIYPSVDSQGFVLSVPMAGHPIMDAIKVKQDFERLQALIEAHDALFLLMDTRESRWLPTVIGKASDKIVMNAALGFDSYVVMRHGRKSSILDHKELGCYFCNDVVAPADSMADRTLDQQCTVTRPGIAPIASALLVELFVGLLQHPLGASATAVENPAVGHADQPLGIVPHQIRGFLADYRNVLINGKSYENCSACSPRVTNAYTDKGWSFVKRALEETGYVEELSGLAEVQRQAEVAIKEMEAAEASDFEDEEGELL